MIWRGIKLTQIEGKSLWRYIEKGLKKLTQYEYT